MRLYKDLLNAPHVLIAGTTGSGKSVTIHGLMAELMQNRTPADAQIILIDPKRVELADYRKTQFCKAYTVDAAEAVDLLDDAITMIECRFDAMQAAGRKESAESDVYIIIDELADLMISNQARFIKIRLQKILQIGRAAKVHIIAATQAPNRKIIPAEIVLNFTHRIALRCLASIESRQIVNAAGAEKLPRYGKGLYLSPEGLQVVDIPVAPDARELIEAWTAEEPTIAFCKVDTIAIKPEKHSAEFAKSLLNLFKIGSIIAAATLICFI